MLTLLTGSNLCATHVRANGAVYPDSRDHMNGNGMNINMDETRATRKEIGYIQDTK